MESSADEFVALRIDDEIIKQLGKLLGRQTDPSPTSVAQSIGTRNASYEGEANDDDNDAAFQIKVNQLASRFFTETIGIARIHMQNCCSMNITEIDIKFALEQFAKKYVQGPAPYMYVNDAVIDSDENVEDDEWTSSEERKEDESAVEDDNNDRIIDDFNNNSDQNDNNSENSSNMDDDDDDDHWSDDDDTSMSEDRNDDDFEVWITRPRMIPTPLFDTMFPHLHEDVDFFKFTNHHCEWLARQITHIRFWEDLPFVDSSIERLKNAFLRFVVVELLKVGNNFR